MQTSGEGRIGVIDGGVISVFLITLPETCSRGFEGTFLICECSLVLIRISELLHWKFQQAYCDTFEVLSVNLRLKNTVKPSALPYY